MGGGIRLWRARRRHDHIDAVLQRAGSGWVLQFSRNDKPMLSRPYARQADARADAVARLKELQRAGWTDHW